ncbi:MAG: RagB/SusD family nutrient uptake outer membrane protein [Bacteroidales bacterium]|nr:RagB/SusD family nutrient uptake outer membrane protein [Bacteroidales bacterium]
MKTTYKSIFGALLISSTLASCDDYLEVSSPAKTDDTFVTSSVDETFKVLSWAYAEYRTNTAGGANYNWEDCTSDAEYYPEFNSSNNTIGMLFADEAAITGKQTQFNSLYNSLARAKRLANILESKSEYTSARSAGTTDDWTQLYGESVGFYSFCYFMLTKHFGDVPFGIENSVVTDGYSLTSRYEIYDRLIEMLQDVEPYMYRLGEGGITAERISRSYVNALIGQIAYYAAGWQTIRTDVDGLYGDIQFETKGTEANGCIYARRTDYKTYLQIAEKYFTSALNENSGTAQLVTVDSRTYCDNPFQMVFQYAHDNVISPESFFEIGNQAGLGSERPYSQGRPSNGGGSNAAPCKSFAALRIIPNFYYTGYEDGDKRMDPSMTVTGSDGKGNEAILQFVPGSRLNGGISNNKWDDNRMNPPYVAAQRQSGINYVELRVADVMLMLAVCKAELGSDNAGAISLVNQIRRRAFGDDNHQVSSSLSGDDLLDVIYTERKRELLCEGAVRWDMILSGNFTERAIKARQDIQTMIDGIEANGYYEFANGRQIPAYIWIKEVKLDNTLTYDRDESDPALTPGWRGQYDYSTIAAVASKVTGTDHNLAIKGLFNYIDPNGAEAAALEADGYVRQDWGVEIVKQRKTIFDRNILGGLGTEGNAPRYYHPIPLETITQSKGQVTNGYGLPQS